MTVKIQGSVNWFAVGIWVGDRGMTLGWDGDMGQWFVTSELVEDVVCTNGQFKHQVGVQHCLYWQQLYHIL